MRANETRTIHGIKFWMDSGGNIECEIGDENEFGRYVREWMADTQPYDWGEPLDELCRQVILNCGVCNADLAYTIDQLGLFGNVDWVEHFRDSLL